jgi:hypothetical protein
MPTPAKNRFEQVDEPQPDALNLVLTQTPSGQDGRVVILASALSGEGAAAGTPASQVKDIDSGALPAVDAFRSAVKLANELKLAVVVVDPDRVWHANWGELFRDEAP